MPIKLDVMCVCVYVQCLESSLNGFLLGIGLCSVLAMKRVRRKFIVVHQTSLMHCQHCFRDPLYSPYLKEEVRSHKGFQLPHSNICRGQRAKTRNSIQKIFQPHSDLLLIIHSLCPLSLILGDLSCAAHPQLPRLVYQGIFGHP